MFGGHLGDQKSTWNAFDVLTGQWASASMPAENRKLPRDIPGDLSKWSRNLDAFLFEQRQEDDVGRLRTSFSAISLSFSL